MTNQPGERKTLTSRFLRLPSMPRNRPSSPQPAQFGPASGSVVGVFARQTAQLGFVGSVESTSAPGAPPVAASTIANQHTGTANRVDNAYTKIGGLVASRTIARTLSQRIRGEGVIAVEGFKTLLQALYGCSDMFLPLKTAAGGLLTFINVVNSVCKNKEDLDDLYSKLEAIVSIVSSYHQNGGEGILDQRINRFCAAIVNQLETVEGLLNHSMLTRIAEHTKDAGAVLKVLQNIQSLCDVFQMDTQLQIEVVVEEILKQLQHGTIDELHYKGISHKTRHSSYGNAGGCMPGTRVKILSELETWVFNDDTPKVYWLVGMAGTGKSTITQSLCEMLDEKNMLGASFFCSRGTENGRNARLIIPTIAHELASLSPGIKCKIMSAIQNDGKIAEPGYNNLEEQFKRLIYHPVKESVKGDIVTYKLIAIDGLDECADLRLVASLIRCILKFASELPLKIFIASRDESLIHNALQTHIGISIHQYLHEIDSYIVVDDIQKYVQKSLLDISHDTGLNDWPPLSEVALLVSHSGALFIYAATAIRYIEDAKSDIHCKSRLSAVANQGLASGNKFDTSIDHLYGHILEQACMSMEESEILTMRELLSMIVFLQNPLSMDAIASISQIPSAYPHLSPITSVIHIPSQKDIPVTPFHASFPDFVTDSTRCSLKSCPSFPSLVASESHEMLSLKCLELMNHLLRYNICDLPTELTVSREGNKNPMVNKSKIPEALKYACVYWAAHLPRMQQSPGNFIIALHTFILKHLLHWIECLSLLGELQTGLESLGFVSGYLSTWKEKNTPGPDLHLLVEDARRILKMNFASIEKHCMQIYNCAMEWIPKHSLSHKFYNTEAQKSFQIIGGVSNSWDAEELCLQHGLAVYSVAFSQDSSQVASGCENKLIRIWNATTGQLQMEMEGHIHHVVCIAFSPDGTQLVSGSTDRTICIWSLKTAEVVLSLEGHKHVVSSVEFSPDGSQVVSASCDKTVRLWNAMTGNTNMIMEGHTNLVYSAAFSPDGTQVVSGSEDKTIRIWNTKTGKVQIIMCGQTRMRSVGFSPDATRVVSGSADNKVCIWNAKTGDLDLEMHGHNNSVRSVAFSPSGTQVVSGSKDNTIIIWNANTGELEMELKGHTNTVTSVAFSKCGTQVISGSLDHTVRIWSTNTVKGEHKMEGHTGQVLSVTFSQDGTKVVSGSDDNNICVWNANTGTVDTTMSGHTDAVLSVAFSLDGNQVVSGSRDKTICVWDAKTGVMEVKMRGHTDFVRSVVFSPDGTQVVSGSQDHTVCIWNAKTGQEVIKIEHHSYPVHCVAFSPDGSQVLSASGDNTVGIWDAKTGDTVHMISWFPESKRSAAFSQDGSHVVFASDDNIVRVWNAKTHHYDELILSGHKLPDSSEVYFSGVRAFNMVYPGNNNLGKNYVHCMSHDHQWIVGTGYDCWIPPKYQDVLDFSTYGSKICLGCKSGRVIILDML